MMTGRWDYLLLVCVLTIFAALGCGEKEPAGEVKSDVAVQKSEEASPLEGCWRSVKMEGADIGSFIKEIKYTFGNDGSFVAEATMTDGSTDKLEGTFHIEENKLFRLVGGVSQNGEFEFEDGKLILHDPYLDTRVWFEKQLQ